MKKFPYYVLLLVILSTGGNVVAQGDGDRYVQASLKRLLSWRTIECDLRMETMVSGKEYAARGHYNEQALLQASPDSFFRSQYRLEILFSMNPPTTADSEPNRLTLVCYASEDGEVHQIDRCTIIEGEKEFSIIDLKRLEQRLKETNREVFFQHVSEVRNLGGLAGMMRQIHRFYEFSKLEQEELHDEEKVSALKLTGTLRSIPRKELLTRFGGLGKKGEYPSGFPSDIELWLGRHNDFPYKVRYLRRSSEKSESTELLFQESFYRVVLNGPPIPNSRFAPLTIPEGIFREKDDTDNFIKALGL